MTEDRVPTTEAGRNTLRQPPGSLDEWRGAIIAIEAEAQEQPAPLLDVRRQVVEQIRREFRRPENMLTSFKAYTPDEPQGFMKAYVAEAVDRILDEVARDD